MLLVTAFSLSDYDNSKSINTVINMHNFICCIYMAIYAHTAPCIHVYTYDHVTRNGRKL